MLLKGNRFKDTEEIKRNATTQLLAIPKSQFEKMLRTMGGPLEHVWCLKGTTLKGIRTATPQVS
jgi:hypothetical protein